LKAASASVWNIICVLGHVATSLLKQQSLSILGCCRFNTTCLHMKNIKKTGWSGHPHPPFKSFSTKYPAWLMVFIISSISIMLMGETQLGIFGLVFLTSGWSEPLRVDNELSNINSWREVHEKDEAALRPSIQDISSS